MREMEKMCRIIEEELGKIAEKGLNTSNLETAYKLIDMYKDIKNTEYWDTKCEYYMSVLDEMQEGGNSYAMGPDDGYSRRNRDRRGRYARNDGYDRGHSYANRGEHYVRGHYSRSNGEDDYGRYMEHKHSYRSGDKSSDCKQRMLDALERHMDSLTEEIADMSRDADCGEERQVLQKYIDKLKRMM